MLHEARIQSEGQLEALERSSRELRAAVARAARGDFRRLAEALDTKFDTTALERLAHRHPELRGSLDERRRLEAEAAAVVKEHARRRMNLTRPTKEALAELIAEPMLFEGQAHTPWTWFAPAALALFALGECAFSRHLAPLLVHGVFVVVLVVMALRAPWLRLTTRRLFIGNQVLELAQVRELTIERTLTRSWTPYHVTAELVDGRQVLAKLAGVPRALTVALEDQGVVVHRTGWWF